MLLLLLLLRRTSKYHTNAITKEGYAQALSDRLPNPLEQNYRFVPIRDLLEPRVPECKKTWDAFKFFRDHASERYEFENPEVEHDTRRPSPTRPRIQWRVVGDSGKMLHDDICRERPAGPNTQGCGKSTSVAFKVCVAVNQTRWSSFPS